MRVLVVGNGGREHSILWKLAQSPRKPELFAAPGNAGTAALATNLPAKADDVEAVLDEALIFDPLETSRRHRWLWPHGHHAHSSHEPDARSMCRNRYR